MPCNVQRGEFYIANDGPESNSEIIANVLPRMDGILSRSRSMTWGMISYTQSHLNNPFGIALEHMRVGFAARTASLPDAMGVVDVSHWIIIEKVPISFEDFRCVFKILEPTDSPDERKDYLLHGKWFTPTKEIKLNNDMITRFHWELGYPENERINLLEDSTEEDDDTES